MLFLISNLITNDYMYYLKYKGNTPAHTCMVEQLAAINVYDLEPDDTLVLGVIDFTSD